MTHSAPILQLSLLFILAASTGTLRGDELDASSKEAVEDREQDSETTKSPETTKPVKVTEFVSLEPELVDVSEIIPLLEKEEFNRDSLALMPKEGELSNFDGGSYLFVNASEMNVAVQMGDEKFELNPQQGKLIHPATRINSGACQVTLSYERENEWKIFRKTRWMTTTSYRTLIFFHQDPESGQLMVKPIVDVLPYDPSKAE